MKRFWTLAALLCLSVPLVAAPARAQNCTVGGHNETSENFAPGGWSIANMTPGTVTGAPSGSHLVISEVAPRGAGTGTASDSSEYVEIYNPTPAPISLDHVYISDDPLYWTVVNGAHALGQVTDFLLRFPSGLMLNPGNTAVICVTKQGFSGSGATATGAQYFLEMRDTNGNTADDMISLGTNSSFLAAGGLLTNPSGTNGETLNLFCWGGSSDLVCDLDYASWGAATAANVKINKTGVAIDGPDAGSATTSYLPDTPAASQSNLGSSTVLNKPNTYQRTGGEVGETPTGGNGCYAPLSPVVGVINWGQVDGTPTPIIRFHLRWLNNDPARTTDPIHMEMRSQEFGVFLPDIGLIGETDVPPIQPNSFFDVFFEVELAALPPEPPQELPGGGPPPGTNPCGPDTNWTGNVDVMWTGTGSGTGITGSVNKHYGNLLIAPGAGPSYLHIKAVQCAVPATWSIPAPLCPGFSATLVNEDKSPAPNPLPVGWTGWISVTAAPGTPVPTTCCFPINFTCQGVTATLDLCVTTCGWIIQPVLSDVDWTKLATTVRFHQRWTNPDPSGPSAPVSGDMSSQPFGVFAQNYGPIGHFDVPPIQPNSFFDVFLEVPIAQLPPEPTIETPNQNPGSPCPTDTSFHVNVDINWNGPGGSGQVGKHYGDLFVCPGSQASYIHTLTFCGSQASWSINGVCAGFAVTLFEEDKTTPAPNPVPPGWTGWIAISAPAATPLGSNCCFDVTFVCDGEPGKIEVCAITCGCGISTGVSFPTASTEFGIHAMTPNPTSGATDIAFALTRAGNARVEIFDTSGKRVRVLVSGATTAGPHTVHWNGRGENGRLLPPGAYFVTLKANDRFASRKIVLFR